MENTSVDLGGGASAVILIIYFAVLIFMLAAMWKMFKKAGKPGWAVIVPIYNIIVLLEIARKPLWWIVLFFIPFVNIIAAIALTHSVSTSFGKGAGFTAGLIFLPFIFYPILGFGDAEYRGETVGGMQAVPVQANPSTDQTLPPQQPLV